MSKLDFIDLSKEINNLLNARPKEGQKRNIVFWFDSVAEFADKLDSLGIENGKVAVYDGQNYFNVKCLLEIDDTESNYLVYAPIKKPDPLDNYLYDIMLYSSELVADITTIYMRELGLTSPELVEVVKNYALFLKNIDRRRKLKNLLLGDVTAQKFHIAVFCAIMKQNVCDFDKALAALFVDFIQGEDGENLLGEIAKFCDISALDELLYVKNGIQNGFDKFDDTIIRMLLQHLSFTATFKMPPTWQMNIGSDLWKNNSYIFVDNFVQSNNKKFYDKISEFVASKIGLKKHLPSFDIEEYLSCETFIDFDNFIIEKINNELLTDVHDYSRYISIIGNRKSYFLDQKKYEYECLSVACKFFAAIEECKNELKEKTSEELFKNYAEKYEKIDSFYRRFILSFDKADSEILEQLSEKIETVYSNLYLNELSNKWISLTKDKPWGKDIYNKQWNFYDRCVKNSDRVAVIVSDSLRYEVGVDLCRRMSKTYKAKVEVTPYLSVLPSYTELGMAALLPHNSITYNDKASVYVDGTNSNGVDNRGKIIDSYDGDSLTFSSKEFMDIKRATLKEQAKGKKLIYIFHNHIDAIGDNIPTENKVFDAVETAMDEIMKIINKLFGDLTMTNVLITADHGFIYKRNAIAELDKTIVENKNNIKFKRRFILTSQVESDETTYSVPMKYLMPNSDLACVLPYGYNIFHKQGESAKYVHGGGSLQEVVVPVIKYFRDRSESTLNEIKYVGLSLTSISRKITSLVTYLDFFQTEKVTDKVNSKTFKVYFVDDSGNVISNSLFINADSKSENEKDRAKREKFTFKSMVYDKHKNYYLIMEDEDQYSEKIREPFQIDLLVNNGINF